jgi:hypothetical protein
MNALVAIALVFVIDVQSQTTAIQCESISITDGGGLWCFPMNDVLPPRATPTATPKPPVAKSKPKPKDRLRVRTRNRRR